MARRSRSCNTIAYFSTISVFGKISSANYCQRGCDVTEIGNELG